jgi:hypothetical protein
MEPPSGGSLKCTISESMGFIASTLAKVVPEYLKSATEDVKKLSLGLVTVFVFASRSSVELLVCAILKQWMYTNACAQLKYHPQKGALLSA